MIRAINHNVRPLAAPVVLLPAHHPPPALFESALGLLLLTDFVLFRQILDQRLWAPLSLSEVEEQTCLPLSEQQLPQPAVIYNAYN